jgi:hypothetical protein
MGIGFDVLCTDPAICPAERQQVTVRIIGEILPFVIAKYQSRSVARRPKSELALWHARRLHNQDQ